MEMTVVGVRTGEGDGKGWGKDEDDGEVGEAGVAVVGKEAALAAAFARGERTVEVLLDVPFFLDLAVTEEPRGERGAGECEGDLVSL